ncbi:MAG: hypothetical protein M1827_007515 [Pycnora praestabilis]|nr:MAG: hypothetical protein M1827_007515 [Pycnora praestabilis]
MKYNAPGSKQRDEDDWWVGMASCGEVHHLQRQNTTHIECEEVPSTPSSRSVLSLSLSPSSARNSIDLAGRIEKFIGTREVVKIDVAYMALIMDVITEYAYARSTDFLDEDDFNLTFIAAA